MKRIILLSALILITSFSFAQTQGELNDDAKNNYEVADKELNKVYNNILKEYKTDVIFIKSLKKSQKIWIQFRDTEMKVKFPEHQHGYYGSVQPMCWSSYKAELTTRRITDLKIWLEGIEEGNVCSGSIKIKR